MKKIRLKLELDALEVQSFGTEKRGARPGTVVAHDQTERCGYSEAECNTADVHWKTCGNSCINMCLNSIDYPEDCIV